MQVGNRQAGFTLIAVLAALAILAFTTQAVLFNLSQQAQREREARLLEIGQGYVDAIGRYYETSPGTRKAWPQTLEDLLEDKRWVSTTRYLRQISDDPITRSPQWGLITADGGGIRGVYSLSSETPIRRTEIALNHLTLPAASQYRQWKFVYQPDH
jgi:type II secretory pathway pseudopilin PulG